MERFFAFCFLLLFGSVVRLIFSKHLFNMQFVYNKQEVLVNNNIYSIVLAISLQFLVVAFMYIIIFFLRSSSSIPTAYIPTFIVFQSAGCTDVITSS